MKKTIPFFIFLFLTVSVWAQTSGEPVKGAIELQEAFVKVAKEVGPAVVSISTEHIEKVQSRYYYFSPFEDEFFNKFFKDFFIIGPEREFKRVGLGSGVIIDKEGSILTNEHVVRNADKITVTLPDGREFIGEIKGADARSDLAVIKIDAKENLPFARLGDSETVKIGQWAIAIGNPFGFAVRSPEPTLTVGVISALNRSLPRTDRREREYNDLIQTDAAINPGNSGGPLVNIYGEVIGINVAIFTTSGGSEGIGFAIPVNTAKRIAGDLIKGRKVLYGWLGVHIQDIDQNLANYFRLRSKEGALVARIVKNSPADKAGIRPGDIIVSFADEKVKNTRELIREVARSQVGKHLKVGVIRNGIEKTFEVEISARTGEEEGVRFEIGKGPEEKESKYWRGIETSDITQEIVKRYGLTDYSGIIVINIEPGSPADEAGLISGDIIYEINRTPINNLEDYYKVTKDLKGDALIGTYRGFVIIKER